MGLVLLILSKGLVLLILVMGPVLLLIHVLVMGSVLLLILVLGLMKAYIFSSPSVLDRLNPLLEPKGVLTIDERGVVEGNVTAVVPHPNFRSVCLSICVYVYVQY